MSRRARVVIPGTPHHVIQRGNRRQPTFFCDADYRTYLSLAAQAFREVGVEVWSYCLMPNHVHLIATPSSPGGLAAAMANTHLRYTQRINRREEWTGYLWKGRFASFPMDDGHFVNCLRYIGMNPVRAGLVKRASDWRWSSVRAHLEGGFDPLLTPGPVQSLGEDLSDFYTIDLADQAVLEFRRASTTGRPLGGETWVKSLESQTGRRLTAPKMGRPVQTESRDRYDFSSGNPEVASAEKSYLSRLSRLS